MSCFFNTIILQYVNYYKLAAYSTDTSMFACLLLGTLYTPCMQGMLLIIVLYILDSTQHVGLKCMHGYPSSIYYG